MRFLANENVPGPVVAALREHGHDIFSIKESMRGAEDPIVLARAQTERRVVVTLDKDFGELAFRSRLPAQSGVILIRLDWKIPRPTTKSRSRAAVARGLGRQLCGHRTGSNPNPPSAKSRRDRFRGMNGERAGRPRRRVTFRVTFGGRVVHEAAVGQDGAPEFPRDYRQPRAS